MSDEGTGAKGRVAEERDESSAVCSGMEGMMSVDGMHRNRI